MITLQRLLGVLTVLLWKLAGSWLPDSLVRLAEAGRKPPDAGRKLRFDTARFGSVGPSF